MADLKLLLEVVTKGTNNLKKVSDDLSKVEDQTSRLGKTVKTGLAFGGGIVAAMGLKEGVEFLAEAVTKAGQFEDSVSATAVIFGQEAVPALEEFADSASSGFGASRQLALDSANSMAVFGKSAGLAGDDLQEFATGMTQLGGDLASFRGGTTEEAITAIGAALRGESEPIRRYGILLDDATLRQKALELGLIATVKQGLTPQVRVLAAQAEILEQSADAQGDFGRTSEGFANTQREIAAEFDNLQLEIGQKLLPVMVELAHFVRDVIIPTFSFLGETIDVVGGFINRMVNPFGVMMDEQDKAAADTKKLISEQASSWEDYSNVLSGAFDDTQEAAQMIAKIPRAEIEAEWDDIRAAAFEQTVQYQLGILDAQDKVKTAMEVLTRLQEDELTKAQQVAYLQGQLASAQLASGLSDPRSGVRGAAEALRAEIIAELAALGVDAYDSGLSVSANVAAGIYASAHLADGASSYLASKISGYLPRSNAEVGPLSDIESVGGAIVASIAGGIFRDIGVATSAASALASELAVSPQSASALGPDVEGALGASGGLPGGTTVIINVEGDLRADEGTLPGHMMRALFAADVT